MPHHDPQHALDLICGTAGTGGGIACLTMLEILPIALQILSFFSLSLSIAWFIYRFYKSLKRKANEKTED